MSCLGGSDARCRRLCSGHQVTNRKMRRFVLAVPAGDLVQWVSAFEKHVEYANAALNFRLKYGSGVPQVSTLGQPLRSLRLQPPPVVCSCSAVPNTSPFSCVADTSRASRWRSASRSPSKLHTGAWHCRSRRRRSRTRPCRRCWTPPPRLPSFLAQASRASESCRSAGSFPRALPCLLVAVLDLLRYLLLLFMPRSSLIT